MQHRPDVRLSKFDIHQVPVQRRARAWADTLNDNFFAYEVDCFADFTKASVKAIITDTITAATITSDPMSVFREAVHVAKDRLDAYVATFPVDGDVLFRQRGRESAAGKGGFTFISTSEAVSYHQKESISFSTFIVPAKLVRDRRPDADDFLAQDFSNSGLLQIFTDFSNSFCQNMHKLSMELFQRTQASVLDMLALVLDGADMTSNDSAVRMAHRRRIFQEVERQFRNPEAGLVSLSKSLGISPRYLQRMLADNDESVSDVLRKRRISEACRLLSRNDVSKDSVSTVAYSVGYADAAYFSRVFRQHMGMSPSEYAKGSA